MAASPLYLLAVLCSARRSKDRALERVTRRRLDSLGVRIAFGDEPTAPGSADGEGPANVFPLRIATPDADPPAGEGTPCE